MYVPAEQQCYQNASLQEASLAFQQDDKQQTADLQNKNHKI